MTDTLMTRIGSYLGSQLATLWTSVNAKASQAALDTAISTTASNLSTAISTLKGTADTDHDTLGKLQGKIADVLNIAVQAGQQITVADIAARNAYVVNPGTSALLFVLNDGDGSWALYRKAVDVDVPTYTKLSDPDLLNAAMSAAAIKSAYESNADTNAFTDDEKAKLAALPTNATLQTSLTTLQSNIDSTASTAASNLSTAVSNLKGGVGSERDTLKKLSDAVDAIGASGGSALTTAIDNLKGTADTDNDTLGKLAGRIDAIGTYAEFTAAFDAAAA